jgi:nucleotide-binding universal stress UspA family protein
MERSVIVGMDGTGDSRNALARAAELARAAGLTLVVVHVRHIPVLAEMSSMTIGPARQNLDLIEAEARRASEEVLQGTGVDWEFIVRGDDSAWNPASASGPALRAVSSQSTRSSG